jgi:hypothetical protein
MLRSTTTTPVADDVREKFRAGEHSAFVTHEEVEKAKLRERERDGSAVHRHLVTDGVDLDAALRDRALVRARHRGGLRTSQNNFDPREQFLDAEGLRDVVVRADPEPDEDVRFLALARHHNDGKRLGTRVGPQATAHLEAVDAREHEVEQHDVVGLRARVVDTALTVGSGTRRRSPPSSD